MIIKLETPKEILEKIMADYDPRPNIVKYNLDINNHKIKITMSNN